MRLALLSCAIAWWASAPALGQAWIPLSTQGGHLTFPVTVEGIATTAMLDTGSTGNSIDETFAQAARLPRSGRVYKVTGAFSQETIVRSVAALDVRMFGLDVRLRHTPALQHPATPLVVGVRVFDGLIVQIDYPASRMRVLPQRAVDMASNANVRIRSANGGSRTAIEIEFAAGEKRWMILDTGASGESLIMRAAAERLGLLDRLSASEGEAIDVNGTSARLQLVNVPSVRIGPFELANVPIGIPDDGFDLQVREGRVAPTTGTHIMRGARVIGIVGYDVLRHFVLTIDHAAMKAHVALPSRAEVGTAPIRPAD